MNVRLKVALAAACLLVCVGAGAASAQITTGSVAGTVKDAQGGVIPGATVILTSEARGTKSSPVVTNGRLSRRASPGHP